MPDQPPRRLASRASSWHRFDDFVLCRINVGLCCIALAVLIALAIRPAWPQVDWVMLGANALLAIILARRQMLWSGVMLLLLGPGGAAAVYLILYHRQINRLQQPYKALGWIGAVSLILGLLAGILCLLLWPVPLAPL